MKQVLQKILLWICSQNFKTLILESTSLGKYKAGNMFCHAKQCCDFCKQRDYIGFESKFVYKLCCAYHHLIKT